MGRPPKYPTPSDLQARIDAYFESCFDFVLNKEGSIVYNPETCEPLKRQVKPFTINGLALACGMSRRQFIDYCEKDKEFNNTITHAKQRIEEYAETRLYDRDGARGAEFNLRCNFGWTTPKEMSDIATAKQMLKLKEKELELKNNTDKSIEQAIMQNSDKIQTLSEMLNNPKEDRNLSDYE